MDGDREYDDDANGDDDGGIACQTVLIDRIGELKLYGVEGQPTLGKVMHKSRVIDLVCATCGAKTNLYCWNPMKPADCKCAKHYAEAHASNPDFDPQMSVAFNAMCDILGASRDERHNSLLLQHINYFLHNVYCKRSSLLNSALLRHLMVANCNPQLAQDIVARSAKWNGSSLNHFLSGKKYDAYLCAVIREFDVEGDVRMIPV